MASKAQEFAESLARVDAAIAKVQARSCPPAEKEAKMTELTKLKEDLELALRNITAPSEALPSGQVYVGTKLTSTSIGLLCNAYYEADQQWYPALIEEVEELDSSAVVLYYGFNERVRVPYTFVQLVPPPDPKGIVEGATIEALYTRDGKWHPAVVEGVNGDLVQVKYQKWPTKENLKMQYVRLAADPRRTLTDRAVFEVPDKLKILPNDPEEVRKLKRKRTKAMKKAWRQQQHEKASEVYQSSWKNFSKSTEASGLTKLHKTSLFRSPDTVEGKVGVTGSGQGITHFQDKVKWKEAFAKTMDNDSP